MARTPFPTQLSEIELGSSSHRASFFSRIKELRKPTLSIRNRIQSVLSDAEFVSSVASCLKLPLIANERCGSWYIDPANKAGSTYFKSTDGHHGQWDFSLRRLNLHLLPILGEHGGAIVVDSTRRGKGMPDAFSKTVPIWTAVMNKILFPSDEWSHALQKPPHPDQLTDSEISQIEARLESLIKNFRDLRIDVRNLQIQAKKPIRIVWAINGVFDPGTTYLDLMDRFPNQNGEYGNQDCNILVLCSASRRVYGSEMSAGGYIQGAGDDSEGWSHGLNPDLFWCHKDELLSTPESELPDLVQRLIAQKKESQELGCVSVLIRPTQNIYIGNGTRSSLDDFHLIINCNGSSKSASHQILDLECRTGKPGSEDLRKNLKMANSFVMTTLERQPQFKILITCATGNDLSVGVALVFLCLFYNDLGQIKTFPDNRKIDKKFVKQRLAWISTSKPGVNPSRSTLQAVNSFLDRAAQCLKGYELILSFVMGH